MATIRTVPAKSPRLLYLERLLALVTLINLALVLFDYSYVAGRDLYLKIYWAGQKIYKPLQNISFFQLYDPYKGIEPHRDTEAYLQTVELLKNQVNQSGLNSPAVDQTLQELREQSVQMIEENPFQIANKTGSLERIKNLMREHIFQTKKSSSKASFELFWSRENLATKGWEKEIDFFSQQIQPIIQKNYYRQIGENGQFIDKFWKIDRWFIGFFLLEFIVRTWWLYRSHRVRRWFPEAVLLRWYDLILLIPFWQLLRVIPVLIRLNLAKFPDLEPVREQVGRRFINSFAEELTEVVVLQVLSQFQNAIIKGEVSRLILEALNKKYIDINNTNEIEEIIKRLLQITLCKALPQIRPDLEKLIQYHLGNALNQVPVPPMIKNIPEIANLPNQLTFNLAQELAKIITEVPENTYNTITNMPPDPIAVKLTDRLVEHFSQALRDELKNNNLVELQTLTADLVEEIKINYVKRQIE